MGYFPHGVADMLRELFNVIDDEDAYDAIETFTKALMQHLPSAYWTGDAEATMTVPLYDAIDDAGEFILDCGIPLLLPDSSWELKKQLLENEAHSVGISLRERRTKHIPQANERKEKGLELLKMYFAHTPFLPFFYTEVAFTIDEKALSEHAFFCAKPGHGKTTLLSSFTAQFLQDPEQPGLIILDPAGDWFEEIVQRVPPERLVVLDPETNPPPLNFFDFSHATEAEALQSFRYLMSSLAGGLSEKQNMIAPYLLRLISKVEKPTFTKLRKLMDERPKKAEQSEFYDAIQRLDEEDRDFFVHQFFHNDMNVTKNAISVKIHGALGSQAFRQMFNAEYNSFDARAALRDRKVVVARGSENTLGEHGLPIFMQFIVSQVFMAALGRFRLPKHQRHQCYLLCDEASHIYNHQSTRLLVECRKLGLSFFSATQLLQQIPPEVKAAVYGATSIKAAGNLAWDDASTLARQMRAKPEDILSMKTFEWMFYVADSDKPVKVRVKPGALERLPKQKAPHLARALSPTSRETRREVEALILPQEQTEEDFMAEEIQRAIDAGDWPGEIPDDPSLPTKREY